MDQFMLPIGVMRIVADGPPTDANGWPCFPGEPVD